MSLLKQIIKRGNDSLKALNTTLFNTDDFLSQQAKKIVLDFTTDLTDRIVTGSDKDVGGNSDCIIEYDKEIRTTLFKGHIRTDRIGDVSGYCAFRTQTPRSILGETMFDASDYRYLHLRVRSDDRKYMVNLTVGETTEKDIFRHRLYSKPNEWQTVIIPLNEFVLNHYGYIDIDQLTLVKRKIMNIGISITDLRLGPFKLELKSVGFSSSKYLDY